MLVDNASKAEVFSKHNTCKSSLNKQHFLNITTKKDEIFGK